MKIKERREKKGKRRRRENVINTKLEGYWLHLSSYHRGDTEMIQTPT
jgi:hypothetical protein